MRSVSPVDRRWMRRALALACRGLGNTRPNPIVGTVVLDAHGKVCGKGYHERAGKAHAEVHALIEAGERARGGTLYVTLEPCSHFGRTPPCVNAIVNSGIRRVVVAMVDPNPREHGKGIAYLRKEGIQVDLGVCREAAQALNLPFQTSMSHRRPLVTAKVALSLDGKIGVQGKRLLLSDPACRPTTMRLRAEAGAILVGVRTILSDNPRLTPRGKFSDRRPIRAVLDPRLETPPRAKILSRQGPVWIFCTPESLKRHRNRADKLEKKGATLVPLAMDSSGKIPPIRILKAFERVGVNSLLLEGGAGIFSSFHRANTIDRWVIYLAPKLLGPAVGRRPTVSLPWGTPFALRFRSVIRRGTNLEIWRSR